MEEKESRRPYADGGVIAFRDEDFQGAALRLDTPAKRLEWALMFAQEHLGGLSQGRLFDLKVELAAFRYFGDIQTGEEILVATGTEMQLSQAQEQLCCVIAEFLNGNEIKIGPYTVTLSVSNNESGLQRHAEVVDANRKRKDRNRYAQEIFELGLLLREYGHLVKSCPAPKLRSREGEVCGRWFIGRPNQTYCSSVCQSRATTKAARERKQR